MHAERIVRCQNLLPPALERRRRRAAALGGDLERPAEMLARMAQARCAGRSGGRLRHRARGYALSCSASDGAASATPVSSRRPIWPGNQGWPCAPRPIMTASAPDISSAVTAFSNEVMSPLTTSGIGDRVPDRAHRAPIRLALVELAAGAAMHGDHLHAGGFRAARQFRRVERAIVPAEPHLQRHRHFHRRDRRLDQFERVIEIAHQRRAGLAAGHMTCRATHVDVDDVGAGGFRDPRALRHPLGLAAGELNHMRADAGRLAAQPRHRPAVDEFVAGGHLGHDQPGAEGGG